MNINDYDSIADLYDLYVPVTFDVGFFLNETKKVSGEVLELMSGTGRVSIPLLQAGIRLTCVDGSARSNAIFARKLKALGLQAQVHQMDVRSLDLHKKFDMVIIPFHSFAHLVSPADQRIALERIHRHLSPGGTFICTLQNPVVRQKDVDGQLRLCGEYPLPDDRGVLLLWITEDRDLDDPQVVHALQFYEEYDAAGLLKARRFMQLHFRVSEKEEFEKLAIETGFTVKAFYGDYEYAEFRKGSSSFMVWVLEKVS